MHKLTAAILAAFNAAHRAFANASIRVRAFLVELHVANLKALVKRAEARVERILSVARYHRAAAYEADVMADEATRKADAVVAQATAEAAAHGATLGN